jgi:hypothetical protein
MKALRNFQLAVSIIGAAFGLLTYNLCEDWLLAQELPFVISIAFSVFIIVVSYLIFRIAAASLVGNCCWLRKLLLRDRFVEGVWREIVLPPCNNPVVTVASVKYDALRNNIRYGGHIFTTEGKPAGFFKTDMGLLDWPLFHYKYTWSRNVPSKSTEDYDNIQSTEGYGKLQFSEISSYSGYYEGLIVDLENGTRLRFVGWKIQDQKEEAMFVNLMGEPESMVDIMREFAQANSRYWRTKDDNSTSDNAGA